MPLQIKPVLDFATCRIMSSMVYSAFAESPFAVVLYPNGQSSSDVEAQTLEHFKEITEDPGIKHLMVVDTDKADDPIAFATYYLRFGATQKDPEEDAKQRTEPIPGCNALGWTEITGELQKAREKWIGRKEHLYLRELATSPAHQRRGAGSMLIQWGVELGKARNLPVYLFAFQEAWPAYEKNGFKTLDTLTFDMKKYGGQDTTQERLYARFPDD